MANQGTKRYVVFLSCLHTLSLTVLPRSYDEQLFCFRCDRYMSYVRPPSDYSVRCDDCEKYPKKKLGSAVLTAHTQATKHYLKFLGHRVHVLNHGEIEKTYHYDRENMPQLSDVAPF